MLNISEHMPPREKLFALSIVAVLALIAFMTLRMVVNEICEFIRCASNMLPM